MSVDPVARLAALQAEDAEEAVQLRFPPEERSALGSLGLSPDPWILIEAAARDFTDHVDEALRFHQNELVLSVEMAELIAIALKTRKKLPSRPKHTEAQQIRRDALVAVGRQLKTEYQSSGMSAGAAEEKAAQAVADIGRKLGDVASAQTIRKLIRSRPKKPA